MNIKEIEALLEKYFEGETNLKEEKMLQEFFCSKEVPEHLKQHQPLFGYFQDCRNETLANPAFEQRLEERLQPEQHETPVIRMNSRVSRLFYVTGIAAGVLLLAGLFFTFQRDVFNSSKSISSENTTAVAYAQAQDALMLISRNFNKGMDKIQYLSEFDKGIQKIQMLSEFYTYQTKIINPDITK